MEVRYAASPKMVETMDSEALRNQFLVQNLFHADQLRWIYQSAPHISVVHAEI